MEELEKLHKLKAARSSSKWVSISEPEARKMKQADGSLALSYNAQISADAAHGLIVGVEVTQAASDWDELLPAVERIEQRTGRKPQQIVADGGYTSRAVIEEMAERKMDFLGSMPREDASTGSHRSQPAATECVRLSAGSESLCLSGRQIAAATRTAQQEEAGHGGLPLRGEGRKTVKVVRANQNVVRGIRGEAAGCCVCKKARRCWPSGKKWPARKRKAISPSWKGRGVLPRMDQKQIGPAAVSRARSKQSSHGAVVGLPYLQPAALDPSGQAKNDSCTKLKEAGRA